MLPLFLLKLPMQHHRHQLWEQIVAEVQDHYL